MKHRVAIICDPSFLISSALLASCWPAAAHAQQGAGAGSSPMSAQANETGETKQGVNNQITDIVVTAEKRIGTAQTTPIAMNVFGASDLARNGVTDLQALASVSPSINFAQNQAAAVITIRGVSSHDDSEVGDPAVSVSTDGFYVQRPVGLTASLFDLERIEVLRGPQGTLYGRNATGGAINIITAKPSQTLGGYGSITYGNYNTINTEGALNVPITGTLALRASYSSQNHDGYLNRAPVADADDIDSVAARLMLLWKPTDRLKILLIGSYLHQGGIGPQGVGIPYVAADDGSNSHIKPHIPGSGHVYPMNTEGFTRTKTRSAQWNVSYDFGDLTATYLGGYSEMLFARESDLDGTATFSDGFSQREKPKTTNHEFRLSSNGDGPLRWQAGYFHFNEDSSLYSALQTFSDEGTYDWGIFDYTKINTHSNAVFAQGSYTLNNGLALEGGLRYTKDSKSRFGTTTFFGEAVPEDSKYTSSAITWHTAANWQLTNKNLAYAKVDRGYKAGGFNNGSDYDPEYITAYEIGSKNTLLDRRLQLNTSVFYYDYRNLQVKQFLPEQQLELIKNAGKATLYGVELETAFQIRPADRIDFSATLLHAKFGKFSVSDGAGENIDLTGNTLQQAPTLAISAGYQHGWDIFHGDLTARVQLMFQSSTQFTIFNLPDDRQAAYTKTDLSLIYHDRGDWQVQIFARNLENNRVLNIGGENNSYGANFYQFGPPRTYGAKLTANF